MAQLMEKTLHELKDIQKDIYIVLSNSISYYGKIADYDNNTIILTAVSSATALVIVRSAITSMTYEP